MYWGGRGKLMTVYTIGFIIYTNLFTMRRSCMHAHRWSSLARRSGQPGEGGAEARRRGRRMRVAVKAAELPTTASRIPISHEYSTGLSKDTP